MIKQEDGPIWIENEHTKAAFSVQHGGRLISYQSREISGSWEEYIWFDPKNTSVVNQSHWIHGGVPILFPFAGRVYYEGSLGKCNFFNETFNHMPIHGFVHNKAWQVHHHSKDSISFSIVSDQETIKIFPWKYLLIVTWSLTSTGIAVDFEIENISCTLAEKPSLPMPLSIGFHPYFKSDASKDFLLNVSDVQAYHVNEKGLLGESFDVTDAKVSENTFKIDQLKNTILIPNKKFDGRVGFVDGQRKMTMIIDEKSVIALWTNDQNKYFCIEPWMNIPNVIHEGAVNVLPTGGKKNWRVLVSNKNP